MREQLPGGAAVGKHKAAEGRSPDGSATGGDREAQQPVTSAQVRRDRSAEGSRAVDSSVAGAQTGRDQGTDAPVSEGAGGEPCDPIHLYERLKKLASALFEEIVFLAPVDRAHIAPENQKLAMRALDIARLAEVNSNLCRFLTRLLDERAPWTRAVTPRGGSGRTGDSQVHDRLDKVKQIIAGEARAHPELFEQLAIRIGCNLEFLSECVVELRGSVVAEAVLGVYQAIPASPRGDADRKALQSVLFTVLPYISDWRAAVAACCDHGKGQMDVVELIYRSDTIAEAVMAGWGDRPCAFECIAGTEFCGVGAVQIPAAQQTALFEGNHDLIAAVVEQLGRQFGIGGLNPYERRIKVEAELGLRRRLNGMSYYFLFRDAASSKDPGELWRLAQTRLHGKDGLSSLVLVRMQGLMDGDQAVLESCIAKILEPRP